MLTKPVIAVFISMSLSLLGFFCGTDRPVFAVSNSKIWEERNRKSFWKT